MDGEEFLSFAGKLAVQSSGPAGYRSSASRAYYGVLARALLHEFGFRCDDANEHLWVQRHFSNCRYAKAFEVGQALANLHDFRKRSDYDLDDATAESQAHARACVLIAETLKEKLIACRVGEQRTSIYDEMLAYRKKIGKA